MNKWVLLSLTDFRNIIREQFLWFMLIVAPILQFLAIRFVVPWLILQFPALQEYRLAILILTTIQVCSGVGFVLASILLDEKDEDILTAVKTLPISVNHFLFYRLFVSTMITLAFSWTMVYFGGLIRYTLVQSLAAALLFALVAPIVTLLMATFARNKVEGLAAFKGVNAVLLLPVISLFVAAPLKYSFAIIPMYWTFQYLDVVAKGTSATWLLAVAILVHFGVLSWLFRVFRSRVF